MGKQYNKVEKKARRLRRIRRERDKVQVTKKAGKRKTKAADKT